MSSDSSSLSTATLLETVHQSLSSMMKFEEDSDHTVVVARNLANSNVILKHHLMITLFVLIGLAFCCQCTPRLFLWCFEEPRQRDDADDDATTASADSLEGFKKTTVHNHDKTLVVMVDSGNVDGQRDGELPSSPKTSKSKKSLSSSSSSSTTQSSNDKGDMMFDTMEQACRRGSMYDLARRRACRGCIHLKFNFVGVAHGGSGNVDGQRDGEQPSSPKTSKSKKSLMASTTQSNNDKGDMMV
eukprot:CAMPEP_0172471776 /NCGR_PEP_ID=MMETSP1065-20121228/67995_1 /TAXON_ID=265537 /ORGANISM="Amphiprora paludosa, Strain CCMP125" /LENGTH=242 /DNA_ID=CAMNT_0013229889 /DNA_START=154 /DNA_END=884 /DNA_ORIENTATION=+